MWLQGVKPKRSEAAGTRWKSGSVGKPGRKQAKTQRKTCEDRTENSEKNEAKTERKSTPERRKIDEKSTKNGQKSTKNRFRSPLGAPGRSKSLRCRAGTRSGRPPRAKLGRLGRQVGRLGHHVGCLGRQVGSPGLVKRRSKAIFERVRKLERRSYRFFVVFVTIVESPNLNFRQPVQCFVHFARS